jgi:putative ABC transport system ATP-binding protein
VPALRGVDISIERGEFLVLQGPSGSGKTTLINLLGLLDSPDRGRLLLDGRPVANLDEDALADLRRDRFGFVFQSFSLIPVLSAEENVAYPMALKGVSPGDCRGRARRLLERVGLGDKCGVRPDLLSGGQRQRVAIARALANEPEVVMADEPTAHLDSDTAGGVLDLMQELNTERGVAFVLATHDPRVVARARRVVTLRDGRLDGAR